MKRITTITILTAALVAAFPLRAQTVRTAETQFKAAEHKAQVEGDLKGAIEQYQVIAQSKDRGIAVQALMRMAECYQKLGDAESRRIYEQVVRDYADQKDAATLAHAKLGAAPSRPSSSLVWKDRKVGLGGSVSQDGRYISYVDWDTGDLGVHDVVTGQDRIVAEAKNKPKENHVFAEESVISRDGRMVAFNWWERSKGRFALRIANLNGDPNPRQLYDDPNVSFLEPRDWSPDGSWISVLLSTKDGTDRLVLISATDGSPRVLKSGTWKGDPRVYFSPDGKYVGYDLPQADGNPRDVWLTATDGTGDIPAVVHPSNDVMMGWSPDGRWLLFTSDRTGSTALWGVPISNGRPQGEPKMLKADMGKTESLGMSRSGALFYGISTKGTQRASVQVGSFDSRSGKVGSPRSVSDSYQEDNQTPCWSPDGRYLAYISVRADSSVIVIRRTDTDRVARELPFKLRKGSGLAGWEPNSRALLASGQGTQGRYGAYRINVDSGDMDLLCELPSPGRSSSPFPAWSADGRSLFYHQRNVGGGETAFIRREIASGAEIEVVRRSELGGLHLSPDGNYLATESLDRSKNERVLLLISLNSGTVREVMRGSPEVFRVTCWAPDSLSFYARRSEPSKSEVELWQVPVHGGTARKLEASVDREITKFTLSPDGGKVAFRKVEPTFESGGHEVWILENFLPSLATSQ